MPYLRRSSIWRDHVPHVESVAVAQKGGVVLLKAGTRATAPIV